MHYLLITMHIVTVSLLGNRTAGNKDPEMIDSVLTVSLYGDTTSGNNSKAVCRRAHLKLTNLHKVIWQLVLNFLKGGRERIS